MNVNRLIHIPGWGDFQLECVEKREDPRPMRNPIMGPDPKPHPIGEVKPSPQLQDDLVAENEPDMMDGEQTWPTEEELNEADQNIAKKKKKVPKGKDIIRV